MGYFKTVVFTFDVRGHTKNACDMTFNHMKLKYHKKDVFTWTHAVETLNTKDNVNIGDVKEELFKEYGSMLDKFYSSFKTDTIQRNHIFKVENTDATLSMQCAIHNEAPFVMQPMLKKGQELGAAHRAAIDAYKLETLKTPGLRPIKQVDIYKKFRPFVPRCYWDETCPRPSDEVLVVVKN
jgi:hypothetical protein